MFCKKCGAQIEEDSKFCDKCGCSIKSVDNDTLGLVPVKELNKEDTRTAQPREENLQMDSVQEEALKWYYYEGTEKHGPFSYAQMTEFVKQGKIQRDTLVWGKGMMDWKAAEQSPLVKEWGDIIPMAPASVISDKWLWGLAVGPIIITKIAALWGSHGDMFITICAIIVNTVLWAKDMGELKKTGRTDKPWMYTGLLFVPVYLYVRAKNTNKNYIPLLAWFVVVLLSSI